MSIHGKGKDRRGRPGWEIVIQFKLNGRQMRKACVLRGSKAEARTLEARMRAELEQQTAPRSSVACERSADTRVAAPCFDRFCIDDYTPNAQLHLKSSTWSKRSSQLATLIQFFGDTPLDQLSNLRIDEYKRSRRDADLRNISINNELRVLRRVLTFARDERGISIAVPPIKFLAENERRPRIWTEAEVQKLFDACAKEAPALLPILVCLANTGCEEVRHSH